MFIVHVAGAPGSGKTTLGEALQRIPGVQVFDLDDVNRDFAESNNYVSLTHTDPKKFQRLYQAHIDELIDRVERTGCSVLVFVGINAAILGSWPGKRFLTVNVHATHKLALYTPTELNVQRWIQRDMPELVDELCARLKEDIKVYTPYETDERDFVRRYESDFHALLRDFRPSQRTRDIERFKNYFTKQGFLPRGSRRIEALVRTLATQ